MELLDDRATTLSHLATLAIRRGDLQAARQRCLLGLGLAEAILQKSGRMFPVEALGNLKRAGWASPITCRRTGRTDRYLRSSSIDTFLFTNPS